MFHVSTFDVMDPETYKDQGGGWKYVCILLYYTISLLFVHFLFLKTDSKALKGMLEYLRKRPQILHLIGQKAQLNSIIPPQKVS